VTTRLAIDHERSARARRETYPGQWLPEPLVTDPRGDPAADAELADTLSMAFLLVLERLNPIERAVFLLHDVFAYDYAEVARIVRKSEVNSRQIAARARRRVQAERPHLDPPNRKQQALAERFFAAIGEGDLDGLVSMLAHDAVVYGDGGGKAPQWSAPIVGVDRVAALLIGVGRQMRERNALVEPQWFNGQPGAIVRATDGSVVNALVLDVADGRITAIRSVINPDKLRHLGEVADVRALLRAQSEESSG
jgi:RNA polymerase sigma-70 factor (ECF subfamily)